MNKTENKTSHWLVNVDHYFDCWDYDISSNPTPEKSIIPEYIKAPSYQRTKELEDLKKYSNLEELEKGLFKDGKYKDSDLSKSVWDFVHTMKIGDDLIVISTQSVPIILGVGKISSEYIYKNDSQDAKHIRDVEWSLLVSYSMIVSPYIENWFVLRNVYLFNTEMFGDRFYNEILAKIDKYLERFR